MVDIVYDYQISSISTQAAGRLKLLKLSRAFIRIHQDNNIDGTTRVIVGPRKIVKKQEFFIERRH